jgi:hypothetical protein
MSSTSDHVDNPAFADEWMPSDVPERDARDLDNDSDAARSYLTNSLRSDELNRIIQRYANVPLPKSEPSNVPTRAVSDDESKTSPLIGGESDESSIDQIISEYATIGFVPVGAPVEIRSTQPTQDTTLQGGVTPTEFNKIMSKHPGFPKDGAKYAMLSRLAVTKSEPTPKPETKSAQKNPARMFFVARLDEQNQEFQVLHETSINWAMRYSSGLVTIDYLIKKLQSLAHKMQHIEKKRAGLRADLAECDAIA